MLTDITSDVPYNHHPFQPQGLQLRLAGAQSLLTGIGKSLWMSGPRILRPPSPLVAPSTRAPRLLSKLKNAKKKARQQLRQIIRNGGDVVSAHQTLMRAVRAHHDVLKSCNKSKEISLKLRECNRFLRDPVKYAKNLLNPPILGKPGFSKEVADIYFTQAYTDPDRSYCYLPPVDVPRPPLPQSPFDLEFLFRHLLCFVSKEK